jgi:predicted O-methyltransferase YrrM
MGFPPGHYYSPIPDPAELLQREDQIWAYRKDLACVDIQASQQLELIQKIKSYLEAINYPVDAPLDPSGYYYMNGMFPVLDAEFLFGALCLFKPKRVIEVGSGFSSLVMADVNRRFFNGKIDITCIEPYPRDFLIAGVPGISRLERLRLQDVDLKLFDALESGDVLFIDSSHVCKTGSDVNFLFFEVIPHLKPGVYVHLHDIFLPDEYPKSWLIQEERSWNEQYLLHAFLMFNSNWRVIWMAHYMLSRHPDSVTAVFERCPKLGAGGSFWMQRVKESPN